jgi:Uma2 family endonuclease
MPAEVKAKRHLFSVKDYYRMAEAGILGKDDRVELIEGEIIDMPPIGQPHASVVLQLTVVLSELTRGQAFVNVQNLLFVNDLSVPQPDLVLLRPRRDFYRQPPRPAPTDALLLIEVADSTLTYDRTVKLRLYARAGVPEFWVLDVRASAINIYRGPLPDGTYERQSVAKLGDQLSIVALPQIAFRVDDLLTSS